MSDCLSADVPRLLAEPAARGEAVRDERRAALRAAGGEVHQRRAARARVARRRRRRAGAPAARRAQPRTVQPTAAAEGLPEGRQEI